MRELIVFFDEIEFFDHDRVVFEAVFAHGEHYLDHVLDARVDLALVEDVAKGFEDRVETFGRVFGKLLAAFFEKADGDFYGVVRRVFEE